MIHLERNINAIMITEKAINLESVNGVDHCDHAGRLTKRRALRNDVPVKDSNGHMIEYRVEYLLRFAVSLVYDQMSKWSTTFLFLLEMQVGLEPTAIVYPQLGELYVPVPVFWPFTVSGRLLYQLSYCKTENMNGYASPKSLEFPGWAHLMYSAALPGTRSIDKDRVLIAL